MLRENWNKNGCIWDYRASLNVFLMTTILTWMNGNSHESTCKCPQTCIKVFVQPHCLITSRSFCAWFVSRIQYVCQPIDQHFSGLKGEGKSGEGTQTLCITSSSLVSYAGDTRQCDNTQKSCISEYFLPSYLSSCPLQILFLLPD